MADTTGSHGRRARFTGPAGADHDGGPRTTLGVPLGDRAFLFAIIPGAAVAAGAIIPPLARWTLSFGTGLPLRPVFRVAGAIDRPWEIAVNLALWCIAGLAIGLTGWAESVTADVSDEELTVTQDGQPRTVRRDDVSMTFGDGGQIVKFKCDVHPWMTGYVAVATNPFFAVSDADGSFKIEKLPAGTYTLEAWHERLGTRTLVDVQVAADKPATVAVELTTP